MPTPLHPDIVAAALHAAPVGHTCKFWPVLESTQDVARDLAIQGATSGTIVLAGAQTAGRGTHGRPWLTDPGMAILLSVVLDLPSVSATWLTVVAGVAVVEAVGDVCGVEPSLTWPNDVMIRGRKLAGVLTEVPAGSFVGIVGVGINLAPPTTPLPPGSVPAAGLDEVAGRPVDPDGVVIALARRLALRHAELVRGGPEALLARWRTHLGMLGRAVVVQTGELDYRGTALDVDASGALLVELHDGRVRAFTSGRVREVFGPAGTLAPAGHASART